MSTPTMLPTAAAFVALVAVLGCAGPQVESGPAPPAPAAAAAATPAPPQVPGSIAVPVGADVVARYHATGAQVYACGAGGAGGSTAYTWTLKRPDAVLSGDDGRPAGTHGAGPTWTSPDGSAVVGKKLGQADAPQPDAVPWLLLEAVSNSGTGIFSNVTFIQRVSTKGGKAPVDGCSADKVDTETRVDYTADYYFYRGGK